MEQNKVNGSIKLDIHHEIKNKLRHFININKIPNILFHGQYGCGKKTIVNDFVEELYGGGVLKDLVLMVNCSHGKGIKFIREELKFFAKTNIQPNRNNIQFKCIILSNADKLTMDAQSALRRCIELFSHNTRFFLIAEDKCKLMKPILSRFCEFFIPEPLLNNNIINLNQYLIDIVFNSAVIRKKRHKWLHNQISQLFIKKDTLLLKDLINKSEIFYEKGYSSIDVMDIVKENKSFDIQSKKILEIFLSHTKMRKEIRNEKILILSILNSLFLNDSAEMNNLSFL